jgi:adenylyltransferase/sulfurtransferase
VALDRYRKQALFSGIGEAGQNRICEGRAVVIGCGALGSVIADSLVRAGVGCIRLVDRDFVEMSNLQRQILFDEKDVAQRLPKAIAAAQRLERVNSTILIEPFVADVAASNIRDFISDMDVILDGTDNFETRFLINDAAVASGTPWIHGGCVGSHGQVMAIRPGAGPCLRCLMPEIPGPGSSETCDTAGVIGSAVQIVASLQVIAALKILSGQQELLQPELTIVDAWEGSLRQVSLAALTAQRSCRCCSAHEYPWLEGVAGTQTTVLCGRNSVQISPSERGQLSLDHLASRLTTAGVVRTNPFLMVFQPADSPCELTIFRDGRAIISGTENLSEARSLYARYVA